MKKVLLLFSMLVLATYSGYSQDNFVQVGSASNTAQVFPVDPFNSYSYSQSIYLASEINASGTISSIEWYFDGASALASSSTLDIFMATTSKVSFASKNDWVPATMTLVFSGIIDVTESDSPGWKKIILTHPFPYDGIGNLVVATHEKADGYDTGKNKFWNVPVGSDRSIGYFDGTDTDPSSPSMATVVTNYVPDIKFGGIEQVCTAPYYFTVSNISPTSAAISWEPSATAPSGGSDYYVSTSNVRPANDTAKTGSISSGTFFVVTESSNTDISLPNILLVGSTTYYVWVRNNCGTGLSTWSEMTVFTTDCNPVSDFSEGFETTAIGNLPTCWSKILLGTPASNADIKTYVGAANANTGSNSVLITTGSSTADSFDMILVSPNLSSLLSGENRLKFYAKTTVPTGGASFDVVVLDSNSSDANMTTIASYSPSEVMEPIVLDIPVSTIPHASRYIGFRITPEKSKTLYIDDIQWQYSPLCEDVTQVTVPVITSTGVTISWVKGGSSSDYSSDIAIGTSDLNDPSGLPVYNTTDSAFTTTAPLLPDTEYKVWMRSVCAAGTGFWVDPVVIRTDCSAIDGFFSESFDGVTAPALPSCWKKYLKGSGLSPNVDIKTAKDINNTKPNSLVLFNGNSTAPYDIIAIAPAVTASSLKEGKYRLKFYTKGAGVLDIVTLNGITNSSNYNTIRTFSVADNTFVQHVIEFPINTDPTYNDNHIGIRLSSASTLSSLVYIDNVVWEAIPSCGDVSQITVSDMNPTQVTVNWKKGNLENYWDIAYGVSQQDFSQLTVLSKVSSNVNYLLQNLQGSTDYQLWIRSACEIDGSDKGSWIGPVMFTTTCSETPGTINETFETTAIGSLPSCWSKILRGDSLGTDATVGAIVGDFSNKSAKCMQLASKSSSGNYDIILVSPPVHSTLTTGKYRLRFKGKTINAGGINLEIGTLSDNSNSAEFHPLLNDDLSTVKVHPGTIEGGFKINFDKLYGTTDRFIGLRLSSTQGFQTIKLDDIVWEPIPLCADAENIKVVQTTSNSAYFTWDWNGSNGLGFDINVEPFADTPTFSNYKHSDSADVHSYEYPDLEPSTPYNVWVRSNCHGVDGDWQGPIAFNTECNPAETFSENFDNVTAVYPSNILPLCWSSILRNITGNTQIYVSPNPAGANSKPNYLEMVGIGTAAGGDVILVSPLISTLNQAASYQLSFYASGSQPLEVGTLDTNDQDAVFTKVKDVNVGGAGGNDNKELHIVDMSTAKATDKYIGFKMVTGVFGQSQEYIDIDSIEWTAKLGKDAFDLSRFSYYPNPVKDMLTIAYTDTIKSVVVCNVLGQEVLVRDIHQNEAKIDMTSLENGAYLVRVVFDNSVRTIKVIKE